MKVIKCWFVGYDFYSSLDNNGEKIYIALDSKTKIWNKFIFTGGKNYEKKLLDCISLPEQINEKLLKIYEDGILIKKDREEEKHGFKKDWWV